MSAQTITIISGVLLIAVIGLAGWNARRRRIRSEEDRSGSKGAR